MATGNRLIHVGSPVGVGGVRPTIAGGNPGTVIHPGTVYHPNGSVMSHPGISTPQIHYGTTGVRTMPAGVSGGFHSAPSFHSAPTIRGGTSSFHGGSFHGGGGHVGGGHMGGGHGGGKR
ncbi:MAG: hypothetical protein U0792_10005 [Gemmataceae bacterium]